MGMVTREYFPRAKCALESNPPETFPKSVPGIDSLYSSSCTIFVIVIEIDICDPEKDIIQNDITTD